MQELARSCEGVIRDLINIFTKSYFHARRRDRDTIDQKAVIEGSREWFEQDKARGLDEEMANVLRRIVDKVIGERRARSFLMQRDLEKHPVIAAHRYLGGPAPNRCSRPSIISHGGMPTKTTLVYDRTSMV